MSLLTCTLHFLSCMCNLDSLLTIFHMLSCRLHNIIQKQYQQEMLCHNFSVSGKRFLVIHNYIFCFSIMVFFVFRSILNYFIGFSHSSLPFINSYFLLINFLNNYPRPIFQYVFPTSAFIYDMCIFANHPLFSLIFREFLAF